MELTPAEVENAVKHYANQRKLWAVYNERRRQKKKDEGTYRPRGRPRKNPADTVPPESEGVAVKGI